MSRYYLIVIFLSFWGLIFPVGHIHCQESNWPVLKRYDQEHLYRIALPIGGIGTGTVSLGGRGELRDWEIMNRPAKGFIPSANLNTAPFFAIQMEGQSVHEARALMGPLYDWEYQHMEGRPAANHGLPRFHQASFAAAYPFGQVFLTDPDLPVQVTIQGFNPLVPGDVEASSWPVAVLRYVVANTSDETIQVSVCGTIPNFIGMDGSNERKDWKGEWKPQGAKANTNEFRSTMDVAGMYCYSTGVDPLSPAWGTMAITTPSDQHITYRRESKRDDWSNAVLSFWDDFAEDGELTDQEYPDSDAPLGSLAIRKPIAPHAQDTFTFYLSWHFPNRTTWFGPDLVGNYYTTQFKDAWDVAVQFIHQAKGLEQRTHQFVSTFIGSDFPAEIKEAALFNISTLRTQTVFRTADGNLFGWEGCMDDVGSCWGSCTHVWNYEQATPFLFGSLARKMRTVEFGPAMADNGLMSFRVSLPLNQPQTQKLAAADGQMGTILKFYREWQLSGDDGFLKEFWPNVKKALAFAWIPGGWDSDQDGVMEGCQHNTMDVEYFGPNPQMQIWYLGALKAASTMADYLGDRAFADTCIALFADGSRWTDDHLFNGAYYEQIIEPPSGPDAVAPGLSVGMGSSHLDHPDYQLAKGCLVDQLVGQYLAHIVGLGYLVDSLHVQKTLQSIFIHNRIKGTYSHFNNMRSYILGDETGLLMASWPKGRPEVPFPYFSEVMTGFEYAAAIGMLLEGMEAEGLTCIRDIRNRYDGSKRNPFDEAECGHHYARAMASWAAVIAFTGFQYSGVNQNLKLKDRAGTYFWSNGSAWGNYTLNETQFTLRVMQGELSIRTVEVGGHVWDSKRYTLHAGQSQLFQIQ